MNGSAVYVDWSKIRHFKKEEFLRYYSKEYHSVLHLFDAQLVYAVDNLREVVGEILLISPVKGAISRIKEKYKYSRHYAVNRLSDALDLMVPSGDLRKIYDTNIPEIGGIGVYPDWKPYPGIHIDLRPRKTDGSRAEWMGRLIVDKNGKKQQEYVKIDWSFVT